MSHPKVLYSVKYTRIIAAPTPPLLTTICQHHTIISLAITPKPPTQVHRRCQCPGSSCLFGDQGSAVVMDEGVYGVLQSLGQNTGGGLEGGGEAVMEAGGNIGSAGSSCTGIFCWDPPLGPRPRRRFTMKRAARPAMSPRTPSVTPTPMPIFAPLLLDESPATGFDVVGVALAGVPVDVPRPVTPRFCAVAVMVV